MLSVRAHAKINLTLAVGPRRDDGYHDVRTLLQSIALADVLTLRARRGALTISVRTPGVPADRTNLVWRAAAALWQAIGRSGEPRDVGIRLQKAIPPGAGLGGGSADAAAALVALNHVWRARQSREALSAIGATLGSDVPFFLLGGTALGLGRGEDLYPVTDIAPQPIVLIKPAFAVATPDAYRWLDDDRARATPDAAPAPRLDVGWPHRLVPLRNDLEPPVARRHPEIDEILAACRRVGAVAAAMTGSGSAVFAVFSTSAAAARGGRTLARRRGWLVRATRTLTRREAALKVRSGPLW